MIDRPQKSSPIGRNPAARAASSPTTAALESRATGAPKVDSKSTSIPRARTADERRRMICEAAYYLAERRGFQPGHELKDWLSAECQIDAALGRDESTVQCA